MRAVYSVEKRGLEFHYIIELYFDRNIEDVIKPYHKLVLRFYNFSKPSKKSARKMFKYFIRHYRLVVVQVEYRANIKSSKYNIYSDCINIEGSNKKQLKRLADLLTTRTIYTENKVLAYLSKTL